MAASFDFGELRSLLQQPPSPQVWDALCALVGGARWERRAEQWLPYAQQHLDRSWPDHLRAWPSAWRANPHAATPLVRSLACDAQSVGHFEAWIKALRRDQPPITHLQLTSRPKQPPAELDRALDATPASLRVLSSRGALPSLASSPHLPRLTSLTLALSPVYDVSLAPILERAASLTELNLSHTWITAATLSAIAAGSLPARLTSLHIGFTDALHLPSYIDPHGAHAGLRALASAAWPALASLDLSQTHLSDAPSLTLALVQLPALRTLRLDDNYGLGSRPLGQVLGALQTPLAHLSLRSAQVEDTVAAALLAAPACAALQTLELGGSRVGQRFGHALRDAPSAATLSRLTLTHSDHRGLLAAFDALGDAPLTALHTLGVSLSPEIIHAIARLNAPALATLTHEHAGPPSDPAILHALEEAGLARLIAS